MCSSMRARSGCTSERAARESVGRECGCARAGASADVYSKCQGCNCASSTSAHAQTGPVSETMAAGGAEELLFCHAWLRFIRATLPSKNPRV